METLKSMLQDGHDGSWSSKRIITLLAFVIVSVSYLFDQFTIYKANETLFDAVIYLVIAGLGFTASEKFARKDKPNE